MLRNNPCRLLITLLTLPSMLAPAMAVATTPRVSGSLSEERGVRVLRLHGGAHARGYAHGYLLGPQIRQLIADVLLSEIVWQDLRRYEMGIRTQIIPAFRFNADHERELEGILAGISDRVGPDALHVASVDRKIDLTDLKAMNVYADLQNSGCTTFAAWGPATRDGGMVVGRNLDFNRLPGAGESQLLIVYTDAPAGRKRWVSVTWPGMIGAYTAMNEDGVVAGMHDVRVPTDWSAGPFVPRALALREIVETATANDAIDRAAAVLRESPALCGNNFLVAAPFNGQDTPAAVFEYDGRRDLDGGVSLRTPAWKDHQLSENTIACTNHFRMRGDATSCDRYASVRRLLGEHAGGEIDAGLAHRIQRAAAVNLTLHTLIALPNRREFVIHFCTPDRNAAETDGVRFTLSELLHQPD